MQIDGIYNISNKLLLVVIVTTVYWSVFPTSTSGNHARLLLILPGGIDCLS